MATFADDSFVALTRDLVQNQRIRASWCRTPLATRVALDKVLEHRLFESLLTLLVVLLSLPAYRASLM